MIVERFDLGESLSVLGNAVLFTRVHNPGAAFGILQSFPELFTTLTATAIAVLSFHKATTTDRSLIYQLALSVVLAGAVGNLIDRLKFNYVVDFVDVGVGSTRWPAFNVADSCISIGVALLFVSTFRTPHPESDAVSPSAPASEARGS